MSFQNSQHQYFQKRYDSPKTGEVITFSEYMVSLYQEMESKMRERLEERKEKYQQIWISNRDIHYHWKSY